MGDRLQRLLLVVAFGLSASVCAPLPALARNGYKELPAQTAPGAFDFARLRDLLENSRPPILTIRDLVKALPDAYRGNYALMYKSSSLQEASMDFPRVVMYGDDARVVVSFNGDPSARGYGTLEIQEWNEHTKSFKMHHVTFPAMLGKSEAKPKIETLDFSGKTKPKTPLTKHDEEVNCAKCHQEPIRPNWDPYNFWRGAYGSVSRFGADSIEKGTPEEKGYAKFLAGEKKKGVYEFLPVATDAEVAGTVKDAGLNGPKSKSMAVVNGAGAEPNSSLNDKLNLLNFKRIAGELAAPPFAKYKYAILGAAFCGKSIDEFFPKTARDQPKSLPDTRKEVYGVAKADYEARIQSFKNGVNGVGGDAGRTPVLLVRDTSSFEKKPKQQLLLNESLALRTTPRVVAYKYVTDRMGPPINMANWSMAPSNGTYAFEGPTSSIATLTQAYLAEIQDDPSYLDPDRKIDFVGADSELQDCQTLKKKSLEALAGDPMGVAGPGGAKKDCDPALAAAPLGAKDKVAYEKLGGIAKLAMKKAVVSKCLECHKGPKPPAKLGFDAAGEKALAERLKSEPGLLDKIVGQTAPTASNPMPEGDKPLEPVEREALRDYLRELSKN